MVYSMNTANVAVCALPYAQSYFVVCALLRMCAPHLDLSLGCCVCSDSWFTLLYLHALPSDADCGIRLFDACAHHTLFWR
jgi:hypothetical protein